MILKAVVASTILLSAGVENPTPWRHLEANSEQRQPVYLGATPRELEFKLKHNARATLPEALRARGEMELRKLARALGVLDLEVELWPARDDDGRLVWAYARWRADENQAWRWLDSRRARFMGEPKPFLPERYRTWKAAEASEIFDDFLTAPSLYMKPVFADCVWTDETGELLYGAWLSSEQNPAFREEARKLTRPGIRPVCRVLPQPARLNGAPVSYVARLDHAGVQWPNTIVWATATAEALPTGANAALEGDARIATWPADLAAAYRRDVKILAGELAAVFPVSGRRMRFTRKNSADPKHQLGDLVGYLEERYARLGLETRRMSFTWRGIPQTNLIAVIRGSAPDAAARPILVGDHIDTAFCEDVFDRNARRVSTGGADDNVTAVAGLLAAARVLRDTHPERDIWLTHITGEEFPGDDLGARELVSRYLTAGQDLGGLVLMDMIGYRKPGDKIMQINPGASLESRELARVAQTAAATAAPELLPMIRTRFDAWSYLYNTDGLIFSDAGFPVILLNEHINHLENLERPHYHRSTDRAKTLDWDYALGIVRTAIETTARLAGVR